MIQKRLTMALMLWLVLFITGSISESLDQLSPQDSQFPQEIQSAEETLRHLNSPDSGDHSSTRIRNKFKSSVHKKKTWELPEIKQDEVLVPSWMKKVNKDKWRLDLGWNSNNALSTAQYDLDFGYPLTTEPEHTSGRSLQSASEMDLDLTYDWSFEGKGDYFDWYLASSRNSSFSLNVDSESVSLEWALDYMRYSSYGDYYMSYLDYSVHFSWQHVVGDWFNFCWHDFDYAGWDGFGDWWRPEDNTCAKGKYPNSNGRCQSCPTGCQECMHFDQCHTCDANYTLVEGRDFAYCFPKCFLGLYRQTLFWEEEDFITKMGGEERQQIYDPASMQETCLRCPENCAACTYDAFNDAPFCIACGEGYEYNLEEARCVPKEEGDCGLGMYYQDGDCDYCSFGCAECQWSYGCEVCFDDYVLYYDQWFGETACQYCSIPNCEKCELSAFFSVLTCDQCAPGYSQNFFGRCVRDHDDVDCGWREYFDEHANECLGCPDGCTECEYDEDTCLPVCHDCESGYTFDDMYHQCNPTCSDGMYHSYYYDYCLYCPSGCYDCYEDQYYYEPVCESCLDNNFLNDWDGTCVASCTDGYYFHPDWNECVECDEGCAYCFWDDYDYTQRCEWCSDGFSYEYQEDKCVEGCGEGMYYNEWYQFCDYCPDGCSVCYENENYELECEDCWPGYILGQDDYSYTYSYNETYWGNYTGTDGSAYTYSEASYCYYPYCDEWNFYFNYDEEECVSCPEGCGYCYSWFEDDHPELYCEYCLDNYFFNDDGECEALCPNHKYFNYNLDKCKNCPDSCESCQHNVYYDIVECTECSDGLTLNSNWTGCVDKEECDEMMYYDESWDDCFWCSDYNCAFCSYDPYYGYDWCYQCMDGYSLNYNGECVWDDKLCDYGHYYHPDYYECLSCDHCNECFYNNITETADCLVEYCDDNYYYYYEYDYGNDSYTYYDGDYSGSAAGYDYSYNETSYYYDWDYEPYCWYQCPDGFYYDSYHHTCHHCGEGCNYCEWGWCYECKSGFDLKNGNCEPNCRHSQYYDYNLQKCKRCESECDGCYFNWEREESSCLSCKDGKYWDYWTNTCYQDCGYGQYFDFLDGLCTPCDQGCEYCYSFEGEQYCSWCMDGYEYINGTCVLSNCYYDQFFDGYDCHDCPDGCASCWFDSWYEQVYCEYCDDGFVMNLDGQCMDSTCDDGKGYHDIKDRCVNCPSNCYECYYDYGWEKMGCRWCHEGYTYWYGDCVQDETHCEDGEYYDYNTGSCHSCGNHCNLCYQDQWYDLPVIMEENGRNSTSRPGPPQNSTLPPEEANNDTSHGRTTLNINFHDTNVFSKEDLFSSSSVSVIKYQRKSYPEKQRRLQSTESGYQYSDYGYNYNYTYDYDYNYNYNYSYDHDYDYNYNYSNGYNYSYNYNYSYGYNYSYDYNYTWNYNYTWDWDWDWDWNWNHTYNDSWGYNHTYPTEPYVWCYECEDGYELDQWGACRPDMEFEFCGLKQYFDWDDWTCKDCDPSCEICFNGNSCAECPDGFILFNRVCIEFCIIIVTNKYGTFQIGCDNDCGSGRFWALGDDEQCHDCMRGCDTCYDADTCTYCEDGYELDENLQCVKCTASQYFDPLTRTCEESGGYCPLGEFYNAAKDECLDCQANCLFCESGNKCLQCNRQSKLNAAGKCRKKCHGENEIWNPFTSECMTDFCPLGFFFSFDWDDCDYCPPGCNYCASNAYCTHCQDGYIRTAYGECILECPDYYRWNSTSQSCEHMFCWTNQFYDPDTGNCVDCSENCALCNNDGTCAQCKNGTQPTSSGECVDPCDSYYFSWDPYLEECVYNGNCPNGTYFAEDFEEYYPCLQCFPGCQTCMNDYSCEECGPQYFTRYSAYDDAHNTTSAASGYWYSYILSCDDIPVCEENEIYNNWTNECFSCGYGQYATEYFECMNCTEGCEFCTNDTYCHSCDEAYDRVTGAINYFTHGAPQNYSYCEPKCPQYYTFNYYDHSCEGCADDEYMDDYGNCIECTEECSNCTKNGCLSCDDDYDFIPFAGTSDEGECTKSCRNGYYWDEFDGNCKKIISCDNSEFFDYDSGKCESCIKGCRNCDEFYECNDCKRAYTLANGICIKNCRNGFYYNLEAFKCKKIPTCNSNEVLQVDSLGTYYCESCHIEHCSVCANSTSCEYCDSGYNLTSSWTNGNYSQICTSACEDGLYWDSYWHECVANCSSNEYLSWNNTCEPCSANCTSCSDSYYCHDCAEGFELVDMMQVGDGEFSATYMHLVCLPECESPMYRDWVTSECVLECYYDQIYNTTSGECENRCPDSHYWSYNEEKCLSRCQDGSTWDNSTGDCIPDAVCFFNQYMNSDGECRNCSHGCTNCTSEFQCWNCSENYVIDYSTINVGGVTYTEQFCRPNITCPTGSYAFEEDCYNCSRGCKSCSNYSHCDSCKDSFFLEEIYEAGTTFQQCSPRCEEDKYWNNRTQSCEPSNECEQGEFRNEDEECEPCQEGCESCYWRDSCQNCSVGFDMVVYYGGATTNETDDIQLLQVCESRCNLSYSQWNEETQRCETTEGCEVGQQRDAGGSCVDCEDNCFHCLSGTCEICESGYNLAALFGVDTAGNLETSITCEPACFSSQYWDLVNETCTDIPSCINRQYFDLDKKECLNCPEGCLYCSSEEVCDTCENSYFAANDGECFPKCNFTTHKWNNRKQICEEINTDCPKGKYFNEEKNACRKCEDGCLDCDRLDFCHECEPHFALINETIVLESFPPQYIDIQYCAEWCEIDQYWDLDSFSCINIHNCTEIQYYNRTDKECYNCPDNCISCENTGKCTTCDTPFYVSRGQCVLDCESHQFFNSSSSQCEDKCVDPLVWQDETQDCLNTNCPSNQYYNFNRDRCQSCASNCAVCNQSSCGECMPGYELTPRRRSGKMGCTSLCPDKQTYWNDTLGFCLDRCESNQYYDTQSEECLPCMEGCQSCREENACDQCGPLPYDFSPRDDTKCHHICEASDTTWNEELQQCQNEICTGSTYYDDSSEKCVDCPARCGTCASPDQCGTCNAPQYGLYNRETEEFVSIGSEEMENFKCEDVCSKNGEIWNPSHQGCEEVPDCNGNQYYDRSSNSCFDCSDNCLQCSNGDVCDLCDEPRFRPQTATRSNKVTCEDTCDDDGVIWVESREQCEDIVQCGEGQFHDEQNNECVQCRGSDCAVCNIDGYCEQCKQSHLVIEEGECVSPCDEPMIWVQVREQCEDVAACQDKQFYIDETNECSDCSDHCIQCQSFEVCDLCDEPRYAFDTTSNSASRRCVDTCGPQQVWVESRNACENKKECPPGKYYVEDLNDCEQCLDNNCRVCDAQVCFECNQDHFIIVDGFCTNPCNGNQIWVASKEKCENPVTCAEGEYYIEDDNECGQCGDDCLECEDSSKCTTCEGHLEPNSRGKCVDPCVEIGLVWVPGKEQCEDEMQCEPKQFLDSHMNECGDCPEHCAICSDADTCDECILPYESIDSVCKNLCEQMGEDYIWFPQLEECQIPVQCSSDFEFYEFDSNSCKSCSVGCLQCTSQESCDQCNEPQYIVHPLDDTRCADKCSLDNLVWDEESQLCKEPCDPGFYLNPRKECSPCGEGCAKCKGSEECDVCEEGLTDMEDGTCELVCTDTQYLNSEENACMDCVHPCLECYSADMCKSCVSEQYILLSDNTCTDVCALNDEVWNPDTEECEPDMNALIFNVVPSTSEPLRCGQTTVSLQIVQGFPLNLVVSSSWTFRIKNAESVSNSDQILGLLQALNTDDELSVTIDSTITQYVETTPTLVEVTVVAFNNQGESATKSGSFEILSDVYTLMTNYENAYTVDATQPFDFDPAFQYPNCPDFSGDQPIPDDVQISYFLYHKNTNDGWDLVQRFNSPSIPSGVMTNDQEYQIRFTYQPNAYQDPISDTISIITSANPDDSLTSLFHHSGSELDFNNEEGQAVSTPESETPILLIIAAVSVAVVFAIALVVIMFFKKKQASPKIDMTEPSPQKEGETEHSPSQDESPDKLKRSISKSDNSVSAFEELKVEVSDNKRILTAHSTF